MQDIKLLRRWYETFIGAKVDVPKFFGNPEAAEEERDRSVKNMVDYTLAEQDLFTLTSFKIPEVQRYFVAHLNPGCVECWFSGSSNKHKDCEYLINEYFAARDSLVKFCEEYFNGKKHE